MARTPLLPLAVALLAAAGAGYLLGRLHGGEAPAGTAALERAPRPPSTGPVLVGRAPPSRGAALPPPAPGSRPAEAGPSAPPAPPREPAGSAPEPVRGEAGPRLVLPGFGPQIDRVQPLGEVEPEASVPERVAAAQRLMRSSPEDALRAIDDLLASGDAAERAGAYRMLSEARHPAQRRQVERALADARPGDDVRGLVRALAQYKGRRWGPEQLTGPPDTPLDGDLETAWASKSPEMGEVWIDLAYENAVLPATLRVHETFNPGALARVLVSDDEPDAEGRVWLVAWEGRDPTTSSPGWFEVPLVASVRGRWVRLIVDTDRVPGWNEIDAVELLGEGRRQWAVAALAGSSYSD